MGLIGKTWTRLSTLFTAILCCLTCQNACHKRVDFTCRAMALIFDIKRVKSEEKTGLVETGLTGWAAILHNSMTTTRTCTYAKVRLHCMFLLAYKATLRTCSYPIQYMHVVSKYNIHVHVQHGYLHMYIAPYSWKLSREKTREFRGFVAIHESFLCEIRGVASFGMAKANNLWMFSPRKSYLSPIHKSFLLQKSLYSTSPPIIY